MSTSSEPETIATKSDRLNRALSPVVAGMIIDSIDLVTFGPVGLVLGVPLGALAGYWLGNSLGLERDKRLLCAMAAGVYCTIPFTELLPLATLVGAYARYRQTAPGKDLSPRREGAIEDAENRVST